MHAGRRVREVHPADEAAAAGRRRARTQGYVVSSDAPRLVDGKPSQNPRYLQDRPDLVDPMKRYVAAMGARLSRAIPANFGVPTPVDCRARSAAATIRPTAERGIRSLAVYNPIHYQELPELFMDFICSLTGKSPSTTGAGSEGALTKGPFNALLPITDLNNALVSFILTGLAGFSTAAGHIGPNVRVDHDLSLLVPEIWCRLTPDERDPAWLIREGLLEPLDDFTHDGELILASRLGYRITRRFVSDVLRPRVRQSVQGLRRRDPAAGDAGPRSRSPTASSTSPRRISAWRGSISKTARTRWPARR